MDKSQQATLTLDDKDNINVITGIRGYQNNSDVTSIEPNWLVPPSQNMLITGDTLKCAETRSGYKLLGRSKSQVITYSGLSGGSFAVHDTITDAGNSATAIVLEVYGGNKLRVYFTEQTVPFVVGDTFSNASGVTATIVSIVPNVNGIRSKYDDFVNDNGIKLPIREFLSPSGQSVMETFYTVQGMLTYSSEFAPFSDNETVVGSTSGATATVLSDNNFDAIIINNINGTFVAGETVTGTYSGSTFTVAAFVDTNSDWFDISSGANFPHEICFTQFSYDASLLIGINAQSALAMVGGDTQIKYWFGTISAVTSTTATTVNIQNDIAQSGFSSAGTFIVNGVPYSYASFSGRRFIGVSPTPVGAIAPGDVLLLPPINTQLFNFGASITGIPSLDICATIDNHIFYGSYQTRHVYISASHAFDFLQEVISSQTNLDNLLIAGAYTAMVEHTIKIEITSDVPAPTISATISSTGINDAVFGGSFAGDGKATIEVVIDDVTPTANKFHWRINGGSFSIDLLCSATPQLLGSTGITVAFGHGPDGHAMNDSYTAYIGRDDDVTNGNTDLFVYYVADSRGNFNAPAISPTPITAGFAYNGSIFTWNARNGHKTGDFWIVDLVPAIYIPFQDVGFSLPIRKPGQGDSLDLDAPPITFAVQEQQLYINTRSGIWDTAQFTLSADLLNETLSATRLKTDFSNKSLKNSLTVHTKNYIGFINIENQLVNLGRVQDILQTPMAEVISLPVKNDFAFLKFLVNESGYGNAHIDWADNKIFVCVPSASLWYIYDDFYSIWFPPQTGNLSYVPVINSQICGHSAIGDETYILFSASNDNGNAFTAIAAFPYISDGRFPQTMKMLEVPYESTARRDRLKEVSKLFIEAYKTENTNMYAKVNLEWGNAKNGPNLRLDPIVFTPSNKVSLGKAPLAGHPLANDPQNSLTKFHYYLPFNREFVYEYQPIFYSSDADLYFKIVSFGLNAVLADQRNTVAQQNANVSEVPNANAIPDTPKTQPSAGGVNIPGDVADGTSISMGS